MSLSPGAEMLAQHMRAHNIPFISEVLFHPTRRWRFDFILNPYRYLETAVRKRARAVEPMRLSYDRVAVEVDGGNWKVRYSRKLGRSIPVGAHTKRDDYDKLNAAAELGWRTYRFTPSMVKSGVAVDALLREMAKFEQGRV